MVHVLQALAYQWLGRWYEDIDQDYKQAQHCYERAVALDDDDIIAGKLLGLSAELYMHAACGVVPRGKLRHASLGGWRLVRHTRSLNFEMALHLGTSAVCPSP